MSRFLVNPKGMGRIFRALVAAIIQCVVPSQALASRIFLGSLSWVLHLGPVLRCISKVLKYKCRDCSNLMIMSPCDSEASNQCQ